MPNKFLPGVGRNNLYSEKVEGRSIKMKKITTLAILIMMIILNTSSVFANGIDLYYYGMYHRYTGNVYSLYVNGKKITPSLEPVVFNNRAYVPVREVFEALGQSVYYDNNTQEITVSGNGKNIKLKIDSFTAYVNGVATTIPDGNSPMLITKVGVATKTMVPVRFVSESVGLNVEFDALQGAIKISNPGADTNGTAQNIINAPDIHRGENGVTTININLTKPMENTLNSAMTEAGVLYFDVSNAVYKGASQHHINHGAVKKLRLGLHEGYSRVAIDLDKANYSESKVITSSDKKTITITITSKNYSPDVNDTIPDEKVEISVDVASLKNYIPSNGVKRVVLDPGHGGNDSGAIGSIDEKEQYEKNINLGVAKVVKRILEGNGIEVLMTRSDDQTMSLDERTKYANKMDAAMYVSIHTNAASNAPKANGIEVFYASQNNNNYYGVTSKEIATDVLNNLIKETGATNRGVKVERHYVTRTSCMPAILIELGFITNDAEVRNLVVDEYQQKLGKAIADGVMAHFYKITVPDRRETVEKKVAEEIGAEAAKKYMEKNW